MARILIIEDDDSVRVFLRELLEREGHTVLDAPNGRHGVRLCRENTCELIITDVFMPYQNGLETIAELRQDFPQIKMIAISGGGRRPWSDVLQMAKRCGAVHALRKPFQLEELLGAVREALS